MAQIVTGSLPSQDGWGDLYWVGTDRSNLSDAARRLVRNRDKLRLVVGVVDDNLSYEFDETALVELKGKYYLAQTSGCSCPSPSENWEVTHGPVDARGMLKKVLDGNYKGYTWRDYYEKAVIRALLDEIYPEEK